MSLNNNFQKLLNELNKEKWDMLKLRKYCKVNNIKYEDLTEEELKMFVMVKNGNK